MGRWGWRWWTAVGAGLVALVPVGSRVLARSSPPPREAEVSFVTAVAQGDPEALRAASALAVPGSPAAAFVATTAQTATLLDAAGVARPPSTVEVRGDGVQVCVAAAVCSTFGSFEWGSDGRVASFAVDGSPVGAPAGDPVSGAGGPAAVAALAPAADLPSTTGPAFVGSPVGAALAPGTPVAAGGPATPTSTAVPWPSGTAMVGAPVGSGAPAGSPLPAAGPGPVDSRPAPPPTTTSTTAASRPPTQPAPSSTPTTTVPRPPTSTPTPTTAGPPSTPAPTPTTVVPPSSTVPPPAPAPTDPAPTPGTGARDATLWPFSTLSPWNTPIGSGAALAPASDPRTTNLRAATATSMDGSTAYPVVTWVNATSYSVPVVKASAADPLVTLHDPSHGRDTVVRVPTSAVPAAGTDSNMAIIQPDGRTVDVWLARWTGPNEITCSRFEETSLAGLGIGPRAGIRASGLSSLGGLIRRWEVDPADPAYTDGVIRHALALSLPSGMFRYDGGDPGYRADGAGTALGYVWPATEQDYDSPWTYRGAVPMGTLVVIPRSVDVDRLGLGRAATTLAHALQDYGGYVVDRAGDGTAAFYAEPTVPAGWYADVTGPAWSGQQLSELRRLLTVVTNNRPGSVGGGGTPAVAGAPPLR